MAEPLKAVPRKRRKSVKSRIRARANEQVKMAALEARKTAALEYVGEQLEELIGLLKAEGFKAAPHHESSLVTPHYAAQTPAVLHPCTWCGREGTHQNEDKSGWVCKDHAQYELGGAIQDRQGTTLFEQMAHKPVAPAPRTPPKPSGPKLVIHPTASEASGRAERPEPHIIDPLKGAIDAAANAGGDSKETGTQ